MSTATAAAPRTRSTCAEARVSASPDTSERVDAAAIDMASGPLSEDDRLDRLDDDEQVERDGRVLDVVEVVLQLLHGILHAGAIRVPHLRPTRDARTHRV